MLKIGKPPYLISLIIFCILSINDLEAQTCWSHSEVTITNPGPARTSYPVLVKINTSALIANGRLQPDGDDLRFEQAPLGSNVYYNYWIETETADLINATEARVWVSVPNLPSGTTTLFMRYGNPSLPAVSNGSNVFPDYFMANFTTPVGINIYRVNPIPTNDAYFQFSFYDDGFTGGSTNQWGGLWGNSNNLLAGVKLGDDPIYYHINHLGVQQNWYLPSDITPRTILRTTGWHTIKIRITGGIAKIYFDNYESLDIPYSAATYGLTHFTEYTAARTGMFRKSFFFDEYTLPQPISAVGSANPSQPSHQPSTINFTNVSTTSLTLGYPAATGSPSGYVVVRRAGGAPSFLPADGTYYVPGQTFGSDVIAYSGNGVSFNETGLLSCTEYYYKVYAYNDNGTCIDYLDTSPTSGNTRTSLAEPSAQATNVRFTNIGSTYMTVDFDAAAQPVSGYLVIKKAGSEPVATPGDNFTYTPNTQAGDGVVAYNGAGTSFTETSLSSCTQYYYKVYAYNISSTCINYLIDLPAAGNAQTLSTQPSAQPTGISFSNVTGNSMTINFNIASGSPSGYLVMTNAGSEPTVDPTDGRPYVPGETLSDGSIVIHSGSTTSVSVSSLISCTNYYYRVYSYNHSGACTDYLTLSPLVGMRQTPSVEPSSQPSSLSFSSITSSSLTVSYPIATGTPSGYLVLRKAGSEPTATPVDNRTYVAREQLGDNVVVAYVGNGTSFDETGLSGCTQYFYKVYAYNTSNTCVDYRIVTPTQNNVQTLLSEPSAQATDLQFANIGSSSMRLSYSGAPDPQQVSGYIVMRRAGSSPVTTPVDGTPYVSGTRLGDADITYVGPNLSINETSLSACTRYYYRIYTYNASGTCFNYRTSDFLSGNQITMSAEPLGQADAMEFSNVTSTSMTVSYTAAFDSPSGYLVIKGSGTSPTSAPVDGTRYVTGDQLTDGIVAYVGPSTTFNQGGLTSCTDYYYRIYSYNENGTCINYLTIDALADNKQTLSATPIAQPTVLEFTNVTNSSIGVSFNEATGSPTGYLVLSKVGSEPSSSPSDGTRYRVGNRVGDSEVVHVGTSTSFSHSSLSSCTNYFYKIYSFNENGNCLDYLTSGALSGNQYTASTAPQAQPTALTFSNVTANSMTVSFTEASGSPTGYLVTRSTSPNNGLPPADGTLYAAQMLLGDDEVISFGSATQLSQTGLQACTEYFFKVYSYVQENGCVNYLTSSPLRWSQRTSSYEPLQQPTLISFSNVTPNSAKVTFTPSSSLVSGYLILSSTVPGGNDAPSDGNIYTAGNTIGQSTVVSAGPLSSVDIRFLSSCTDYYLKVFSYNESNACLDYLTSSPLEGAFRTVSNEPTSQPEALNFTEVTSTSMRGSFRAASGAVTGYVVVRGTGTPPVFIPEDGVTYSTGQRIGSDVISYVGRELTFVEGDLFNCQEYFFKLFAYLEGGNCINYLRNSPLTGSQITRSGSPVSQPSQLTFTEVAPGSVAVTFTPPAGPPPSGYVVIRKSGSPSLFKPQNGSTYSTGTDGGEDYIAYAGSIPAFTEIFSERCVDYYYTIYAHNGDGNCSQYLLENPLTGNYNNMLEPTVDMFFPEIANEGEMITLTGENFSAEIEENEVTFNGIPATIVSATPTEIVCLVPGDAESGRITVQVCSLVAQTSEDFVVDNDRMTVDAIITPYNKDGINDALRIKNIDYTISNKVTIIDRYGSIIKEFNDYRNATESGSVTDDFDFASLMPGSYICMVEYQLSVDDPIRHETRMITILKEK